jgi:hypothetical protein
MKKATMLSVTRVALAVLSAALVQACGHTPVMYGPSDDVRVEAVGARATSASKSELGGLVTPDQFEMFALVSAPKTMNLFRGDTFGTAFDVGTAADPTKYGSIGGPVFTIDNDWNILITWAVDPILTAWSETRDPNRRYYEAHWSSDEITCDAQNRLLFRVPGLSRDTLRFTLRQTKNTLIVQQGDSTQAEPDILEKLPGSAAARLYECQFRETR